MNDKFMTIPYNQYKDEIKEAMSVAIESATNIIEKNIFKAIESILDMDKEEFNKSFSDFNKDELKKSLSSDNVMDRVRAKILKLKEK